MIDRFSIFQHYHVKGESRLLPNKRKRSGSYLRFPHLSPFIGIAHYLIVYPFYETVVSLPDLLFGYRLAQ